MPANPLFKSLLKNVPASASIAADGTSSSEFGTFIDTGSYTLNAALSGSLVGGMPDNKITVFAGDSGVGKTFFILGIIKAWLEQHTHGVCVYFDSESAVTNQMLEDRGIDLNRVIKVEPETIEQFRQSALAILDNYEESKTTDPMVMVLDSLGNLSSLKEVTDIREQKDSRDMTKSQLIRGTFRVLRLRLSKLRVPMIVSNHVYAVIGCLEPETATYEFQMDHGTIWVVPSSYTFTLLDGTTISAGDVSVGDTISDKMGTGIVKHINIEYDSTQVVMADGTLQRVDTIVVGDQVQTLDGPKSVTTLYSYDVTERYLITFDDGTSVSATPNHKFLTNTHIWVRADELTKGLPVATHAYTDASERRVASVVPFKTTQPVKVYDFTVEDVHHYVLSNGVVSHNSYVPTKALSGGCLVSGTQVMLPDGTTKPIEEFVVGDTVATAYGPCVVTETYQFTEKPVFELTLQNGETIRCSGEHRFIVNGAWVCAEDLSPGDEVTMVRNINSDEEQHELALLLPDHE